MRKLFKNRYFQFSVWIAALSLWVLWIENYWFFGILTIPIEVFFVRKIKWKFWHKKNTPYTWQHELIEAALIVFIIAMFLRLFFFDLRPVTSSAMEKTLWKGDFVLINKLSYGPRMPITALSLPFPSRYLPGTYTRSYFKKPTWPYKRFKGFGKIKTNDVIAFNLPVGDSIIPGSKNPEYYRLKRQFKNENLDSLNIVYHNIDKRTVSTSRVVALPGNTLKIVNGEIYVNNKLLNIPGKGQFNYVLQMKENQAPFNILDNLNIPYTNYTWNKLDWNYELALTTKEAWKLIEADEIKGIRKIEKTEGSVFNYTIFPYSINYLWAEDRFGPINVPGKGDSITLTVSNLPLYKRIIESYENNEIKQVNGNIYINGKEKKNYTFTKDYYFVMGDNRHNSNDSRFWGFLPHDHIIGKVIFVWFSFDQGTQGTHKIRWKNFFKIVR